MSIKNPAKSVPFGSRVDALDGLRGVAVLAVVMFHTLLHVRFAHKTLNELWGRFEYSAWAGVDLFFVLSGFLITGILLDSRRSVGYFRNFYARRTLRIFPLYYAFLTAALVILPALGVARHMPAMFSQALQRQVWLWTYTQNYLQAQGPHMLPGFGHFWSLAVEEQFYWIWPLIVFTLDRKRLFYFCVACCAALPLLRLLLVLHGERTWAVREYTHTRFDTLLYGAAVAIAFRDAQIMRKLRAIVKPAVAAAIAILAAMLIRDGFVPYESVETAVVGYSAFGLTFAAAIGYLVTKPSWLSYCLSNRALRWFGTYSYGIYVFHNPLALSFQAVVQPHLSFLKSAWLPGVCCFAAVLATSSIAAYLSFVCFEVHFLKLKKYFSYSVPTQSVVATAALLELANVLETSRPADPRERPVAAQLTAERIC